MARAPKLKVFRMPIGFHDAYVAAPSQKAAAEAWGTGTDVFTRGEAELVFDPALAAEPLAAPGTVIKRLRGSAAEQIAALGGEEKDVPRGVGKKPHSSKKAKPPAPRPSRAERDAAEAALDDASSRHAEELELIARREAALAQERKALEKRQAAERKRLIEVRDKAEAKFKTAMDKWRG